jgi:hypothetical protein
VVVVNGQGKRFNGMRKKEEEKYIAYIITK